MKEDNLISEQQVQDFNEKGYLVLESFYDVQKEIEPIQYYIHQIIGIIIRKYNLSMIQLPFSPQNFDSGYQELIAYDRKIGGEIYDAAKQIPAFVRLVCNEKHDKIVSQLRNTIMPGVAAGGYGIRIDNPNEEKFRAGWHQDYPAQFRSLDGIVFWSPLVEVTPELGPVRICVGSHLDGLVPVYTYDPRHPEKTNAYGLTFKDEEATVEKYSIVEPSSKPGDLILFDFLTIHSSGYNRSNRSRWSMQMRYFNFAEETGIKIGWCGSFAAGRAIQDVHPELIIK